ncbi:unnamed protein product [Coccothraustes coccothraustes]
MTGHWNRLPRDLGVTTPGGVLRCAGTWRWLVWFRCYSGGTAGRAILQLCSNRDARALPGPGGRSAQARPGPLAAAAQGPALTAARPGAGAEPAAGRGRAAAEAGSRTLTPGSRSRAAAKETRRTGHRARQVRDGPPAAERRLPQRARPGGGSTGSGGGRAVTVPVGLCDSRVTRISQLAAPKAVGSFMVQFN